MSVLHYNLNAYMQDIVNPDMSPQLVVTRSRIHHLICFGEIVGCYYFASKRYNRSIYPILKLETVIYLHDDDFNIFLCVVGLRI